LAYLGRNAQRLDLSGLNVVLALHCTKALRFQGIEGAGDVRSVILADETAIGPRRAALIDFAKAHAGTAGATVVCIDDAPITMS
jgi:hypothetical protein